MSDRSASKPRKLQSLSSDKRKQTGTPAGDDANDLQDDLWHPPSLSSIDDTGLTKLNVSDLILKVLYNGGDMTGNQVSDVLKLPYNTVLDGVVEFLKREKLVDFRGGSSGLGEASYRYTLTDRGLLKAREALERSQYAGAAPVDFNQYIAALKAQNMNRPPIQQRQLRGVMNNLVIAEEMLHKVGPAVNSGQAIFLYGPPGNGKTTMAERVGEMVLGSDMWIPYAIDVDGQVIMLYDEINHVRSNRAAPDNLGTGMVRDPRWVRIKRPMIMVGGELTMDGLDLLYDDNNKFYEAPYQMKANGGMFLIDDFGRQRVSPVELLNRWIVPLETKVDFLTLNNGRKIGVPFFVMTIFSTNLDPKDLVDEAFLRRIRHKIEVGNPDLDQFKKIFQIMCRIKQVPWSDRGFDYLIAEWYEKTDRDLRMVHPRDILAQIIDIAGYLGVGPNMEDPELIDRAAASYFVEL
ncbi:MAG: ATP-binding protein [Anaerolineaceae bacterium]|nr:MAG: ATP-binding protein [Anaerolineaceae bacterium]